MWQNKNNKKQLELIKALVVSLMTSSHLEIQLCNYQYKVHRNSQCSFVPEKVQCTLYYLEFQFQHII